MGLFNVTRNLEMSSQEPASFNDWIEVADNA